MTEPEFGVTTERLWRRLPDMYRDADERVIPQWQLKTYVSGVGDEMSDIEDIVARSDPSVDGVSELVDPVLADLAWLPWLAQHLGVDLRQVDQSQWRAATADPSDGWLAGTKDSIETAAKTALTGTQYARVYDHSDDVSIGGAPVTRILIVTRDTETPDPGAVLAAVIAKNAKPAGILLFHRMYSAAWDAVEALGSWDAIEATGSWRNLEEQGL